MRGIVARRLRKEVYPKDYSMRNTSYSKNSIRKVFSFFKKGKETKYNVRYGQAVCVGMRNSYRQLKKDFMAKTYKPVCYKLRKCLRKRFQAISEQKEAVLEKKRGLANG